MNTTMSNDVLTTAEIGNDPQWVRPPKYGQTIEGCGRSYLYELIKEGRIRSVALRRREKQRGIRLIHLPSLRKFIAECDRDQNGPAK
jgi:hypothetical protein